MVTNPLSVLSEVAQDRVIALARAHAESFDPASGEWTRLPAPAVPRSDAAVAVLHGCVYVAGGVDGDVLTKAVEARAQRGYDMTLRGRIERRNASCGGVDSAPPSEPAVATELMSK